MAKVDVAGEVLKLTSMIRDPYFRAISYARIGYQLFLLRDNRYKKAFANAVEAVKMIENPIVMIKTLIEIGKYLRKAKIAAAVKVFHQAFEMTKAIPNPVHDELIESIVNTLIELKMHDEALMYTSEIKDKIRKNETLLRLLISYINTGKVRKAYSILEIIDEEPWYSIAAVELLKTHLKREEFGSAMKILQSLKSKYWINEAMKEIAIHLKNYGAPRATFEKFVDAALTMADDLSFDALRNLLVGFGSSGEIDSVIRIIKKMPPAERIKTLKEISAKIIDDEELLRILMIKISREEFIPVAKFLLTKLLEKPDKKYIKVVETIGARTGNEAILVKVVTFLAKVGEYNKALHFAHRVTDSHLRSLAFGSIAVNLLKEGDIDRAIDTALEVKDPKWGSWLLGELLVKILELAKSKEVEDDLEKRANEQKTLWEK